MRSIGLEPLRNNIGKEFDKLPFIVTNWKKPVAIVVPFDKETQKMLEIRESAKILRSKLSWAKKKQQNLSNNS